MPPRAPHVDDAQGWATTRLAQVTRILHDKFERDARLLTYEEATQATVELSYALQEVVAEPEACENLGSSSCWAALLCQLMASRRPEGWTVEDAATQDTWHVRHLWAFVNEFKSERFSNDVVAGNTASNTLVGRGAVRGVSHWLADGAVSNRRDLRIDSLGDDASLKAKARTLHLLLEAAGREGFPRALLDLEPPAVRTFGAAHNARHRKQQEISQRWQQRTAARTHKAAAAAAAAASGSEGPPPMGADSSASEGEGMTTDVEGGSATEDDEEDGEVAVTEEEAEAEAEAAGGSGTLPEHSEAEEAEEEEEAEDVEDVEEAEAPSVSGSGGESDFSDDEDAAFAAEIWEATAKAHEPPSEAAASSSSPAPASSLGLPQASRAEKVSLGCTRRHCDVMHASVARALQTMVVLEGRYRAGGEGRERPGAPPASRAPPRAPSWPHLRFLLPMTLDSPQLDISRCLSR